MHETSPGQVEEHKLSISDRQSELNGAKTKTNIVMDLEAVKNENIDDCDDEQSQRIYDDPCELLDEASRVRLPRSRSWFCCPSTDATTQSNNRFYNRCPDYPLVTEAPRIQFHAVCFRLLRVNQNFHR